MSDDSDYDSDSDYYEVLGVHRDAGADEIKRAYRRLARTYHPDINKDPSAEARFKKITEANDVLSDPDLRKRYDAFGEDFRKVPDDIDPEEYQRAQRMQGAAGRRAQGWQSADGGADVDDEAFRDFLDDLLRERTRTARGWGPIPGADQRAGITLDLESAFSGGRQSLTMAGPEGQRTIQVNIPAGVTDGQTIRLPGQGGRGTQGAPAGDLYLYVTIASHPRYRLTGRDIEVDLPVAPWEAALGATLPVQGPGGTTRIKVAPGTSSGTRLRIRGQGMPAPGTPGDLYARVKVVVPEELTDEERHLYEQLADISNFDPRSGS